MKAADAGTRQTKDPRRVIRLLQAVTLLRSIGQGAALTITSLYLRELGWSGASIGAVIAASSLLRIVFALFGGALSARLGAKHSLLLFEVITLAASIVMVITSVPWLVAAAVTAAGLGSGHSGSGGPAAPIERAWLGAYVKDAAKAKALYGRNALYSYAGLGAGALLACIPDRLHGAFEGTASFRLLYAIVAIITAGCIVCIWRIQGGARKPSSTAYSKPNTSAPQSDLSADTAVSKPDSAISSDAPVTARRNYIWRRSLIGLTGLTAIFFLLSWLRHTGSTEAQLITPAALFVLLIAAANYQVLRRPTTDQQAAYRSDQLRMLASSLSSVTATLTSTVTAYWFAERFGASSGVIGLVMGVSYLTAALLARITSGGTGREATLRTIISLQIVAILLLLVLPWVSAFWLAALIEIGCTACNLGTRGNRTALMMEERGRRKRDFLSRVNIIAVRLTAVLWPGAFVHFVDEGYYVPPFYFAAAMQLVSALLFRRVYRATEQKLVHAEAKHKETTTA
ncbi:MFS transporter [Paenibacillus cellulosilyticus]|uniref:MFS transporter n=1 Tax=Paenibacillus cellulosilyticus TaxID=375489 RepID=A0A2V2YVG9_9BACL|nr:MFS transporter [Paenibacillus cellulosilyticus]PWW05138.1 MFS transporter [Paenibacillus cellulosilyticus]QKS48683.1 MFS transporter [Paenibacillus cellulosilyticus]